MHLGTDGERHGRQRKHKEQPTERETSRVAESTDPFIGQSLPRRDLLVMLAN
ncbi:MAG: hypothetical protein QM775_27600 [Pirellulales bacterium]